MGDKKLVRSIAITVAIIAAFVLLLVIGWNFLSPYVRGHLHILTPRLTGKVTVCDGSSRKTYRFSARGNYGAFEWTLGEDATPVKVELMNYNHWHVSKMNFLVEKNGDEWNITGTIDTDGYDLQEYSSVIPNGEPILIDIQIPGA